MSAQAVELSEAIVERIADGTYTLEFTPRRESPQTFDIKDLRTLQVLVFDGPKAAERSTRTEFQRTYKPTVVVLKKLVPGSSAERLAELDGLAELVEQIEAQLQDEDLAGLSFEAFDEEQERDPYNLDALKQDGSFATPITLTYTAIS